MAERSFKVSLPALVSLGPVPIAGATQWQDVMVRAGYRCECPGCSSHKGRECLTEHGAGPRCLIAAPVRPPADPLRRIPTARTEELRAWCPKCYDTALSAARKAAKSAEKAALSDNDTLF